MYEHGVHTICGLKYNMWNVIFYDKNCGLKYKNCGNVYINSFLSTNRALS